MESDFTITAALSVSDPQQCGSIMLKRKGEFSFNSSNRSFTAKINNKAVVQLLPEQLCKLRSKRCPNGKTYIIRFKKSSSDNTKELALKELKENEKQLVHSALLNLVGVEQEIVQKKTAPPNTKELALKEPKETEKQLVHHSSLLNLVGVKKEIIQKKTAPPTIDVTLHQSNVTVRTTKRPLAHCFPTFEDKENIDLDKHSDLEKPDHELTLPEVFTHPAFWTDLRSDKRLRSGKNGEWVRGQDERLTIDGLLCLSDGEWLNADIIDCFLDHICRQSTHAQFIPTYAILSYARKGTVPSEWYWSLAGTEIVLAPAHLYNNHWAMAVLDMRARTLRLMDSMNHGFTDSEKTKFMDTIVSIIHDVAVLQKVDIGDRSTWQLKERLSVPQQRNGTDCGIFALLFAQYTLERRELDFGQCHIPYFRRRICHDIISVIINDQK